MLRRFRACVLVFLLLAATAAAAAESPTDLKRVREGAVAPNFKLEDIHGKIVSLSDLRGKKAVLVFYRGYW